MRDAAGNYRGGFLTLIGTALLGAATVAMLPKRRE
jgi:hypothetical protein